MTGTGIFKNAADNPVLTHEVRARMRGSRAYWILLGYLLLVGATMGLMALALASQLDDEPMGQAFMAFIVAIQAILIAFTAPAVCCGAITLEREHQTYEMLAATRLRSVPLVMGKLAAALGFLLICMFCTLPAVFIAMAYGGVSVVNVLADYALLVIEAAVIGSISLAWSAAVKSTVSATMLSYLSCLGIYAATLFPGVLSTIATYPGMRSAGSSLAGFAVLGSLCPVTAGFTSPRALPVFGLDMPYWLPGLVIGALVTALVVWVAAIRLPMVNRSRPCWIVPISTTILVFVSILMSGSLLDARLVDQYSPACLWAFLMGLLGFAVPLIVAPPDCKTATPRQMLMASRGRLLLAAGWFVLCAGIVAVSLLAARHNLPHSLRLMMRPIGLLDPASILPQLFIRSSLALIGSLLLFQVAVSILAARLTHIRAVAMIAPIVAGLAIALTLLIHRSLVRFPDIDDIWRATFFTPVSCEHWPFPAWTLFAVGAVVIFGLAMVPQRRGKAEGV